MFTKINIRRIFAEHGETLKHHDKKKTSLGDITLFYFLPLTVSILSNKLKWEFSPEFITSATALLSLIAGLLLNLMALLYGTIKTSKTLEASISQKKESSPDKAERQLLIETRANVSYCIVVSIIALILLTFLNAIGQQTHWHELIEALILFFALNGVLTLFMILKRLHSLLESIT